MSWTGLLVGDFSIEELIAEGALFRAYRGVRDEDGVERAFKVAKQVHELEAASADNAATCAHALLVGHVTKVTPDSGELLALQAQKLLSISCSELVSIERVDKADGVFYCQMEMLEGKTLRQLMERGSVPLQLFLDLAVIMQGLSDDDKFEYHGNLSPENIMVTADGIKLLDPGYWGPLRCEEGEMPMCAVTTPAYYPSLEPDDLLALGLIIWEAALGQRPLGERGDSETIDLSRVGEGLLEWVRLNEGVGKFFLSPILEIFAPSQLRIDMPSALENFLLEAIRLRLLPNGVLDKETGIKSFSAMASAIQALIDRGITEVGQPLPVS
jgi:serine/threonine protein kinase